mmetsp:Transcript_64000/g.109859  ORF Transcript_64000/g.109859 Transcript_64000/m.109859 type:complete len:500 (-) Transcript_64000:178-1677(-)
MSNCEGPACVLCAKMKIKCDKMQPSCGRCVRLGLECTAQARGRGRPPGSFSKLQQTANNKDPVIPLSKRTPKTFADMSGTTARKAKQSSPPERRYMLIKAIKLSLMEHAPTATSPEARRKANAVARWLLNVACCSGNEALHDDIAALAETLDLDDDVICADFKTRKLISNGPNAASAVPNFVAALNSGGSAFLVQASIKGAAVFLTNDEMAASFISAGEAEAVYNESFADPDATMRRLVLGCDRATYLKAVADMVVKGTDLLSETSLVVHIRARAHHPVLCLVQMRASFSADGDNVVFGTKLTPMPPSDYLTTKGPSQPFLVVGAQGQRAAAAEVADIHVSTPSPSPALPLEVSSWTSLSSDGNTSETEEDYKDDYLEDPPSEQFVFSGVGTAPPVTAKLGYSSIVPFSHDLVSLGCKRPSMPTAHGQNKSHRTFSLDPSTELSDYGHLANMEPSSPSPSGVAGDNYFGVDPFDGTLDAFDRVLGFMGSDTTSEPVADV